MNRKTVRTEAGQETKMLVAGTKASPRSSAQRADRIEQLAEQLVDINERILREASNLERGDA